MFRRNGFWWRTYLLFFLLWALASYPALLHAWWRRDDFACGLLVTRSDSLLAALEQLYLPYAFEGRPLGILFSWPFLLNYYPHAGVNIIMHGCQGAGHAATALLLAAILSRFLPRWQAVVTALPFLLWCFNGEPVLYSTSYHYVGGCLFSLLGLYFILQSGTGPERSLWLGAILTAGALLFIQSSATAGLIVWSATVVLRLLRPDFSPLRVLREGIWLSVSFVAGGLLTTLIVWACKSPRGEVAHDIPGKFGYWLDLNQTFFFWPGYYPLSLDLLHGLLLLLGLMVPLVLLLKTRQPGVFFLIFGFFLAAIILPYLANLLVAKSLMPFRCFYIAPLAFTVITATLFGLADRLRWLAGLVTVLIAAIGLHYIFIAQRNADDYIQIYLGEVRVLHDVEKVAHETGINMVATIPDEHQANPFGIHYPWQDSHQCDFLNPYSLGPMIRLMTPLQVLAPTDENLAPLRTRARDFPPAPGIVIHPLPDLQVIYLQID